MVRKNKETKNLLELTSERGFIRVKNASLPKKKNCPRGPLGSLYGDAVVAFINSPFEVGKIEIPSKRGRTIRAGIVSWTQSPCNAEHISKFKIKSRVNEDTDDIDVYLVKVES